MKYNKRLFELLKKYLFITDASWCILGVEEKDGEQYMFLYDLTAHKKRRIYYLLNLMVEHRLLNIALTEDEVKEFLELIPKAYKDKFTL